MLFQSVCISIFCIFCFLGRPQLPAVAAVPFEYNEEHEQYPYDLDTQQSKAKYDTRLLSQQLLEAQQKSSEESMDDTAANVMHYEQNQEQQGKAENANDNDDLQPHERAASCYTHNHKYTHGQKVPRLDPCEVCLCMDGEIFCWWEKCEKRKPQQNQNNKNTKHTTKSHHHQKKMPMKSKMSLTRPAKSQFEAQTTNHASAYETHIDNAGNEHNARSLKNQLHQQNAQSQFDQSRKQEHHTKHQQQKQKQQEQKQTEKQKQLQKTQLHDKHLSGISSSSKIMNFPENLPSVLYYDYHTEEHEHHQHQHHQQHLKHQMQKKIQKLQRERQQKAKLLISGGGVASSSSSSSSLTTLAVTPPMQAHLNSYNNLNRNSLSSPSMLDAYDDLQTDSDILPEPPTKKPKALLPLDGLRTAATSTSTSTKLTKSGRNATSNEQPNSNLYDNEAGNILQKDWSTASAGEVHRLFVGETSATSSIFATDDVIEINKNIRKNPQQNSTHRTSNSFDNEETDNVSNNEEEQDDDAFHRWLASTETYNNDNNKSNNDSSYNDENLRYGNENSYATESSEFENPFGIKNLTINSQRNIQNKNNNNKNNRSNKLLHPKDQERAQNAENGFLHGGAFNNDYSDYNGSVVNIDILLTTQDELRQQQQQHQQKQQQQHSSFQKQAETAQLPRTPASITFAAGLISYRDDTKQTAKALNDTKMNAAKMGGSTPEGSNKQNSIPTATTTTTTKTTTTLVTPTPYVQFIKHNRTDLQDEIRTTPGTATSTTSSERQCNVMGTLYKIGEVLPQDTGNCLQCICIDGSTSDDTPRVTCSPHNCPPLVLPDLFDATGY